MTVPTWSSTQVENVPGAAGSSPSPHGEEASPSPHRARREDTRPSRAYLPIFVSRPTSSKLELREHISLLKTLWPDFTIMKPSGALHGLQRGRRSGALVLHSPVVCLIHGAEQSPPGTKRKLPCLLGLQIVHRFSLSETNLPCVSRSLVAKSYTGA